MSFKTMQEWMGLHEKVAPRYETVESIYLQRGKPFSREPLPAFELRALARQLANLRVGFMPGECYMNAGRISMETDLLFCEGLAMGPWPVPHGWIEYKGRAIDVTWPTRWDTQHSYVPARSISLISERIKFNIANCFYWGIVIPKQESRAHFYKTRMWMPTADQAILNGRRIDKCSTSATIKP